MQSRLSEAGIGSALIGGLALAVWGQPRYTKDVDLKVQLARDEADRLLAALPPGCTPISRAEQMLEQAGMVFVSESKTTWTSPPLSSARA